MSFVKKLGSGIWYFFNSLKLTLGVLIALAFFSIIGTVIEQNLTIEEYLAKHGEFWTKIIYYTRAWDMYHSWWFIALLAALALNIIVCTFERFPPKWKSLLDHKSEKFDPRLIERFSNNQSVTSEASPEDVKQKILKVLNRRKFGVVESEKDGAQLIYAWKGRAGRLGSDVVHISLLLILAGAIVGSFAGYKGFKAVFVGDYMTIPQADFKLKLEKFWIDYYDSGQIKQYNSILGVYENDKEVMKKQIWVNEPLYYKGIRFYQSSYGMAWNKVDEAKIALMRKGAAEPETPVTVKWNETAQIPGTKYSVKLLQYAADFAYDQKTNSVFSQSPEPNNPAVKVDIYNGDKLIASPWLFMKYPGIFPAIPNADEDLVFMTYKPVMYSGLSINKDPGTNIVWAGSIVMGIGFVMAFFVYHRRVWIHIKRNGNSTEVKIGGTISKNNFVFEKDLKEIVDSIKAG